jgi:hypothetical protein
LTTVNNHNIGENAPNLVTLLPRQARYDNDDAPGKARYSILQQRLPGWFIGHVLLQLDSLHLSGIEYVEYPLQKVTCSSYVLSISLR